MKKILFAAYSLDLGGIEKALVTLLNILKSKEYDITLVLEKKQGIFLDKIAKNIKIIEYKPSENKNILVRKIKNTIKRINFIINNKNKYDFSASFATYSKACSFVSRVASINCYLWGHADYLTLFENDEKKVEKFFRELNYNKFKKIIFVSEEGRNNFIKVFPKMKKRTMVCNNLIDGNKIKEMANEKIYLEKEEKITFLNVGRHDEKQKRLTRLIEATERLKKEGYNFKVLLVGEGEDTKNYKKEVKEKGLEEIIIFLGKKQNPYPYFKISDCVILTSDYEGYPVVYLESFILQKPLITTKVSDYEEVENKYGLIANKTTDDIYLKMKEFLKNGFEIKQKFNIEKYNREILLKIEKLIEEK